MIPMKQPVALVNTDRAIQAHTGYERGEMWFW